MKNAGKIFEEDFSKSAPDYCFVHRLNDTAQSYNNSNETKFAWNNKCDFFIFDTNKRLFWTLELKSTKYLSFSCQLSEEEDDNKMIKFHQIKSLREMSKYNNILSGFILNFRNEDIGEQETYFLHIKDFDRMMSDIGKKSFNKKDILKYNAVKIDGRKKRVRFSWNIDNFLCSYGY